MKTTVIIFLSLSCAHLSAADNLLVNGSFENGAYDPGGTGWSWNTVVAGDTRITGWESQGVDWHRAVEFAPAYDGDKMVDVTVGIQQTFNTTPGEKYQLEFAMAAPGIVQGVAHLWLTVGGFDVFNFLQPTTLATPGSPGSVPSQLTWTVYSREFLAVNASTTLLFLGGDTPGSPWGPVIDDVSVTRVSSSVPDAGSSLGLFTLALGLLATARKAYRS